MAKLDGGIFSRPRGKTAGIVFGAARTRTGKVATARQLVPPSNPNTTGQQTQRNKFKECLAIVRAIGASIYQDDWNRAISQLPGFQSMMSILMNNMNSSFNLSAPVNTNLGTLHVPASIAEGSPGVGDVRIDFSTEDGSNGTDGDYAVLIAIEVAAAATPEDRVVATIANDTSRIDGVSELTVGETNLSMIACIYFRGQQTALGLLSQATWLPVTTGS